MTATKPPPPPPPPPAIRELAAAVAQTKEAEVILRAALAKVDFKDATLNNYWQGFSIEDLLRISQEILSKENT